MVKIRQLGKVEARPLAGLLLAFILLAILLLYKLGSLVGGLSAGEMHSAVAAVGWHGIYHQPFYLSLKLIRSVVFFVEPNHGQTLTRLPNALTGGLAVAAFTCVVGLWHSRRIAILTGLLFATGAWTLHASRLASFDVVYLCALPLLLLVNILSYRYHSRGVVWYFGLLASGLLLYVPGLFWLLAANTFFLRKQIVAAWRHFAVRQKIIFLFVALLWLPLLVVNLVRSGQLTQWLGLPQHLVTATLLAKHFVAVPVHLFVRGPQYPDIWLGKAPILDIFTLVCCLIGAYFYITHLKAFRSRLLLAMAAIGWLLVGLGGPVSLSLLVPLLYLVAATGVAYLLHEWLRVFPVNPLARCLGLGLVSLAVALACIYNLRAYFVAWPHNPTTRATFHYRR